MFGVKRIIEFYGSSEGNVAFANLMNKDCTIGMTASKVALVEYDVHEDQIVRNAEGRCVEVAPGEPGLLLGHINENAVFEGLLRFGRKVRVGVVPFGGGRGD